MDFSFVSRSVEETIGLGSKFGHQLKGGEIIGLWGDLGAGKTHFIKGIAAGVGAEEAQDGVSSPTFVLVKEYTGRLDVYHIDAYRMKSSAELEMAGFDDYCYSNSVVVVEWADKVADLLGQTEHIRVTLEHAGQMERNVYIDNLPEYIAL
jgi:tRNA threonylcarbamoyladenosine biosynthesis protein TsaE